MSIPSVRTIANRLNVSTEIATRVHSILESCRVGAYSHRDEFEVRPNSVRGTLEAVSEVIDGFGYEYIPKGHNSSSPAIHYVNMGDTYDTTVLFVRGKFRIGNWGDIVERGSYD